MNAEAAPHSWPFQEAYALRERLAAGECRGPALRFETGYGPSGLPHIGTFGEVARTTMIMRAFQEISDHPVELICFSDDMDGLRKVPEGIPQPEMVARYLDRPLSDVPDPYGTHPSYGAHMNARLQAFLDKFGFTYRFHSATACYRGGLFDAALRQVARHYEAIMAIMLPTLRAERQQSYSPFLPISPSSGRVLYVPMKAVDAEAGTITFDDETGEEVTQPVTGGHCKLQWKPDLGMRWAALGIDFEMYGKDHLANAPLYSRLCHTLGHTPPRQFAYELFLDERGEKISKSRGNGITIEAWLRYAPQESLALYMFQSPKKAKRLYFDVIPKAVDEYLQLLAAYNRESDPQKQYDNPVWAIHGGAVPAPEPSGLSFTLLLNLARACNPEDKSVLWGFIRQYLPEASPDAYELLDQLAGFAVRYYEDFIKARKRYRPPTPEEAEALAALRRSLSGPLAETRDGEAIQADIYRIGREHYGKAQMKAWFRALYETLLGTEQGPRMGSFIALYGPEATVQLIDRTLKRDSLVAP